MVVRSVNELQEDTWGGFGRHIGCGIGSVSIDDLVRNCAAKNNTAVPAQFLIATLKMACQGTVCDEDLERKHNSRTNDTFFSRQPRNKQQSAASKVAFRKYISMDTRDLERVAVLPTPMSLQPRYCQPYEYEYPSMYWVQVLDNGSCKNVKCNRDRYNGLPVPHDRLQLTCQS